MLLDPENTLFVRGATPRVLMADTLDTARIEAAYDAGVLTLRIPVTERAKPRKITVGTGARHQELSS